MLQVVVCSGRLVARRGDSAQKAFWLAERPLVEAAGGAPDVVGLLLGFRVRRQSGAAVLVQFAAWYADRFLAAALQW